MKSSSPLLSLKRQKIMTWNANLLSQNCITEAATPHCFNQRSSPLKFMTLSLYLAVSFLKVYQTLIADKLRLV